MGRISNSFKSQIGRDTGKVVSNFIWGDKHATPYRRIEMRANKNLELKEYQIEIELAEKEEKRLFLLKQISQEKINTIAIQQIPSDLSSLINMINELIILLESNPFKSESSEDSKIDNLYSECIYTKFTQCLNVFKQHYSSDFNLQYFINAESKFKKRRFFSKFGLLIIIAIIVLISIIFIAS